MSYGVGVSPQSPSVITPGIGVPGRGVIGGEFSGQSSSSVNLGGLASWLTPVAAAINPLLGAGVGLASGLMAYKGQKDANKANKRLAQEQMAFQERMSSSAYQRAVEDLRKAGLNPHLAPGFSGSSSLGGSSAQMQNALGAGVSSALEARRVFVELQNLKAMGDQIKSQTSLNQALAEQAMTSGTKTFSDTIRSWVDTGSHTIKDQFPLVLFWLMRRAMKVPF